MLSTKLQQKVLKSGQIETRIFVQGMLLNLLQVLNQNSQMKQELSEST